MDKIELIIKVLSGELQTVDVTPSATVGELKQQIAPLFNVNPSQLKLSVTNGQTQQMDQNQKTVSDHGLTSGSTVNLLILPFQVFVKNEKGQTKTYEITDGESVDQLMRKVSQEEGIPADQQRLIYNGRQLDPGRKLRDYNVVAGSTMQMTLRLRGG